MLALAPKSVKAILAKANAFYGLGLFEKSMTQHYRGLKINSQFDNCAFSKGIRFDLFFIWSIFYTVFSICKNAIMQALDGVKMSEDIVKSVIEEQENKSKKIDEDLLMSKKERKKKNTNVKRCNVLGKLDTG